MKRVRKFEFDGNEVCIILAQKLVDFGDLEPGNFHLSVEARSDNKVFLIVSPSKDK